MDIAIIGAVVVVALLFAFTNGFHDAANAVATSISTGALTPRVALAMAAVMNFIGAFLGQEIAQTVSETIDPGTGTSGLVIVMAGLIGAIAWNMITWYYGLPSSSSHALIGGLVGAALAAGASADWGVVLAKVVLPMLVSPLVAFGLAFGVMLAIMWIFRDADPTHANRGFKVAQTISACAMALGHGVQDAQKTMGVIFLALLTGGHVASANGLPMWVVTSAAVAISLGTWSGGWRIIRTLGWRIIDLDPSRGFAAESVAASVLYTTTYVFEAPVSTTHAITSALVGVGATNGRHAVRWRVVKSVVTAWVLTFPAAGLAAALTYWFVAVFLP